MKSLEELQAIRERMKAKITSRGMSDQNDIRIVVGMATCGIAAGAREALTALTEEVESKNLTNVIVSQTGCIGICQYEPVVEVFVPGQEKVTYVKVDAERARRIIASHIMNGNAITEYTYSHAVKEN